MLLDRVIPSYQFVERHAATIPAPPTLAYRTLWKVDFARAPIIRLLFGVRGRMHARLEDFEAGKLVERDPANETVTPEATPTPVESTSNRLHSTAA